jgi:hypothetical protein
MIPRTFPSIIEAFQTKMVVYVLPSVSGLTAWIDYIPVKGVVTEDPVLANTYANAGYQVVKSQESLTGQAWLDYIPVYEDASYNKPWSTDAGGYIPVGGLFSPASLFAAGEQGWWYDPSNLSTLFQDSAGTTPVTAVEQPVGLQLDLSKGLVLGPELVTNGGPFVNTTGWTAGADITLSASSNQLVMTSSAAGFRKAWTSFAVTAGATYKVVLNLAGSTNVASRYINFDGVVGGNFGLGQYLLSNGISTFYVRPNTSTLYVGLECNFSVIGGTVSINGLNGQLLPGNHRFQTTSANRPVVSARVNLLTKTEQFEDGVWTKANVTVTANTVIAPDGTLTADSVIATTATGVHIVSQAATASGQILRTVYVKKLNSRYVAFGVTTSSGVIATSVQAVFDFDTGTFTDGLPLANPSTAERGRLEPQDAGNGWWQITVFRENNSILSVYAANSPNVADLSFAGTGEGVYVWGADLRVSNIGVNLPVYQRVNTSTDYDSTGFPVYIKPNGSNQFMQTNSIDFTATDKMTVWQGVRKLSDAALGMLTELSTTDINTGSFYITQPIDVLGNFRASVRGGAAQLNQRNYGPYPAPNTTVINASFSTVAANSASAIAVRVNGTSVSGANFATSASTGNFGNYPAYFYARAGTSLYFNGHDYGSIARGAASTAAQITAAENYINKLTKAFT